MKILLAEDDTDLGNVLSQFLQMRGFEVTLTTDGNEALEKFGREKYDICVLDVMMPGPDGFSVAQQIRKSGKDVPFIFLTAKNQKADIITGLKIGADDYITKPFEVEELILRINNVLKRSQKTEAEKIEIQGLVLTMSDLRLKTPLQKHQLTQKEAELLLYLMKNKNEVVPRETILTKFWGENDYFMGRSLDVFISRLRKFISDEPGVQLNTLRGVGYIFEIVG
jgi:DNA-binding response OmpR family regulator